MVSGKGILICLTTTARTKARAYSDATKAHGPASSEYQIGRLLISPPELVAGAALSARERPVDRFRLGAVLDSGRPRVSKVPKADAGSGLPSSQEAAAQRGANRRGPIAAGRTQMA